MDATNPEKDDKYPFSKRVRFLPTYALLLSDNVLNNPSLQVP